MKFSRRSVLRATASTFVAPVFGALGAALPQASALAQTQPRRKVVTPVVGTPTVQAPASKSLRHHVMVWGFVVLVLAALGWSLLH